MRKSAGLQARRRCLSKANSMSIGEEYKRKHNTLVEAARIMLVEAWRVGARGADYPLAPGAGAQAMIDPRKRISLPSLPSASCPGGTWTVTLLQPAAAILRRAAR